MAVDTWVEIISSALISTVSFSRVASCAPSIKPTEDAGEVHLESNASHRFICPEGREMWLESLFQSSLIIAELVFENSRGWNFCHLPTFLLVVLFFSGEGGSIRS